MTYKTIETYVKVDLSEWNDQELVDEMRDRGYTCVKSSEGGFENQDWQMLLEIIDRPEPRTWETDRIREKVFCARHQIE
jgi:hypothetical protein